MFMMTIELPETMWKLCLFSQNFLCETNLDDSIDSGNFLVRGYLPLIGKDSTTDMHVLAVYVKERLLFTRDLPLENSGDSYVFNWFYFTHCLTFFPLLITFFISV